MEFSFYFPGTSGNSGGEHTSFESMFGAASFVTLPDENDGIGCNSDISGADAAAEVSKGKAASLEGYAEFRHSFVTGDIAKAQLTIVGLGFFYAYINGVPVTDARFLPLVSDYAPRKFYARGLPFDEVTANRLYCPVFDVTGLIRKGENLLFAEVGRGWFAEDMCGDIHPYGKLRLCFSLRITSRDGSEQIIVSGSDTEAKRGGYVISAHLRTGETHDYRLFDKGIRLPDGNEAGAKASGIWQRAKTIAPLDTNYIVQPDCPPDRVIRKVKPRLIRRDGDRALYDCGENLTGTPVLTDCGKSGEMIKVRVGERLTHGLCLDEMHTHGQELHVISGGKKDRIALRFTWFGFRYFEVTGKAAAECVEVVHADVAVTSAFSCDNSLLNWLYESYIRTQLSNMHSGIPSDCPHIERCGYTGDGQLTADAVMTMFDSKKFYKKWIGDISDCQDRMSGHVQYTAPYVTCGGGPGGWGCAIVELPYLYYRHFGDIAPFSEMYPQMLDYFSYLDAHSENGLITSDEKNAWCLGDWCSPTSCEGDIPKPLVNTYFYIKSLLRVIELAPLIGRKNELRELVWRADRLKNAFLSAYYDESTHDFAYNVQDANCFGIDIGLGDEISYSHMLEACRRRGCFASGIFGTDIITRLLFEHGDGDAAITMLTAENAASFFNMKSHGATTLWEYFTDNARSDNHPMFGAAVRSLFYGVLGIRQRDGGSGWENVIIKPQLLSKLCCAEGFVTTSSGKIAVSFEKKDGKITFCTSVPDGIEAELDFGGKKQPLSGSQSFCFGDIVDK